jgi:hypothetical protein
MNLVRDEINLGSALFEALSGQPLSSITSKLRPMGVKGRCCDIPAPCWMPQSLGECVSHTSECKSASLDLLVTNTFVLPRNISITISGTGASLVQVNPNGATIPALDHRTFTLSVQVPQNTASGPVVDVLVVIRGCRTYYLRWKVSVGTIGCCACSEIRIDDGPDLIHHWYDHFYCQRPCPNGAHQ